MSYQIPDCYRKNKQTRKQNQPSRPQAKDLSGKPLHRPITENDAVLSLMHPLLADAVKAYKRLKGIDVFKDLNMAQQRECEMMIMQGKLKSDRLEQFYSKIFKATDKKEKASKVEGISSFEDIINLLQDSK